MPGKGQNDCQAATLSAKASRYMDQRPYTLQVDQLTDFMLAAQIVEVLIKTRLSLT